jgi:hypothetical protein
MPIHQKGSDLIGANPQAVANPPHENPILYPLDSEVIRIESGVSRAHSFRNAKNNRQKNSGYKLTSKIASRSLKKRKKPSIFTPTTRSNNNMLRWRVSERSTKSRTQITLPKLLEIWRSKAAGAAMAGLGAITPAISNAQDAAPVAYLPPTVSAEMEAEERRQLIEAGRGAAEFAMSCPETRDCVGIIFHMGDDMRRAGDAEVLAYFEANDIEATDENMKKGREIVSEGHIEFYATHFAEIFGSKGMRTKLFPRTDYGSDGDPIATTVSYHIGDVLYHSADDYTYLLMGNEADGEVARVKEALGYAWQEIEKER